jgi:hypothetical protein
MYLLFDKPLELVKLNQGEKPGQIRASKKLFDLGVIYQNLKSVRRNFQVSEISASGGVARCPFTLKPTITANTE